VAEINKKRTRKRQKISDKLSAEVQDKVIEHLASGFSSRVISAILKEEDQIDISQRAICRYNAGEWKKRVQALREKMDEKVADHALASKKVRLNWLQKAANECMEWRLDKIHFDKDGNELARVHKRQANVIPAIIREARQEIEGESTSQNAGFNLVIIRPPKEGENDPSDKNGGRSKSDKAV